MVRFLMSSVFLRLKNEAFFGRILFNRRFLKMFLVLDVLISKSILFQSTIVDGKKDFFVCVSLACYVYKLLSVCKSRVRSV